MHPVIPRALGAALPLWAALLAVPATAEEYKLVLQPETGTSVPARVCLASRSVAMRAVELPNMGPIAEKARCGEGPEGTCFVDRGPPAAGCSGCVDGTHPDCRAQVRAGLFPLSDYTIVCADDQAQPVDGGTVYIVVESVEAENPPEFYSLEVTGGRVRWSPVNRLGRPSYTVVGGDFEHSVLSYPRGRGTPEWAEVPIRRRCRCITTRQPVAGAPILSVTVDGAPICRGESSPDGSLRWEVPATAPGSVRSGRVRTTDSESVIRWSGRWPSSDQPARLVRFRFELDRDCTRPSLMTCPEVSTSRATCDRPAPIGGRCRYTCTTEPTAAVDMPLELSLRLQRPEIMWSRTLRTPGQRLRGGVPPDRRVLTLRVPAARLDTPGDEVTSVQVSRMGQATHPIMLDGADPLHMPVADLRCGASLVVSYMGRREFAPATVRIGPGGAVDLPAPSALGTRMSVSAGLSLALGTKGLTGDPPAYTGASDTLIALNLSGSLRYRLFARRWFISTRVGLDFSPDGLFLGGGETPDGEQLFATRDEPYLALELSLLAGYVASAAGGLVEIYGGPGVGGGYPIALDLNANGGLAKRAFATIGLKRPLGLRLARWSFFVEARGLLHWSEPPLLLLSAGPDDPSVGSAMDVDDIARSVVGNATGPVQWSWALSLGLGLGYQF